MPVSEEFSKSSQQTTAANASTTYARALDAVGALLVVLDGVGAVATSRVKILSRPPRLCYVCTFEMVESSACVRRKM